jgi:hypothetical protein
VPKPNVLVDLEFARQQRRRPIVALFFGGICIPTPDVAAAAVIAVGSDLGPIVEKAILAGAKTIQVVYRGGNYDEARAANRTATSVPERQERVIPSARASLR